MRVTVELDVPARMRDGVVLRANVFRPEGDSPWPTLLARQPYGKDDAASLHFHDPVKAARLGFMVVIQDVRGRFASDGEWVPYREREDGYDSVEWAARLPGSSGRVGMYGASYLGKAQWMAAAEQPPALAAIAPSLTWCDPRDGVFSRGGAVELASGVSWMLHTGAAHIARLPLSDVEREAGLAALLDECDQLPRAYWDLPVHDLPVVRRHSLPDRGTFRMLSEGDVPAWAFAAGEHDRVTVPSFNVGGWHDIFLQGTLDNYMAMAARGVPSRLVVGPWAHDSGPDATGERYFGIRSRYLGIPVHEDGDVNDLQFAWLRRQLVSDGATDECSAEAPVRIFVMGRNEWREETSWPLERARPERWFLGAGGALRPEPPGVDEEPTRFAYDPADPVPSLGGVALTDQAPVESRQDVRLFTSEPLRDDLEVTGRVRVVLSVESSAPSTDWVARLCDVHPDGTSLNVCDGITRVHEGADSRGRVEIDLWSTSIVFLKGHRLRVHVTSSSFPRWDRNLNTGDQRTPRLAVAQQRVYHDACQRSFVELSVVP
jgi:putative CocE/NonD family hydrolase